MNIDVDKIVVSLDVVAPDSVVVEASAVAPSGIVTEAVAELPTQVIVISHEETPTVSPLQIIDYGSSSIECAFDVTTEQAEEVVKGVLCGTENPPTFENADYRLLHGQGSMDLAFAGLNSNTEYYLRPYALSNLGYKYGDVVAQRTKVNPIPEEYQLVEYLRGTGNQFINTNFIPTNLTVSRIKAFCSISIPLVFYGYYKSNDSRDYRFFISYFDMFGGRITGLNFVNRLFEIELGNFYVEDLYTHQRVSGQTQSFGTADYPIHLFGESNSSTPGDYYYVKIIDNDVTVRDMYPVYRKADSKPGMYDIINNVFYINQGSGEFIVGPDKEWEE